MLTFFRSLLLFTCTHWLTHLMSECSQKQKTVSHSSTRSVEFTYSYWTRRDSLFRVVWSSEYWFALADAAARAEQLRGERAAGAVARRRFAQRSRAREARRHPSLPSFSHAHSTCPVCPIGHRPPFFHL